MESKNNVVVILLVVFIGVFSGVGLLIGIGNAVNVAMNPLNAKIAEISVQQRFIENKLASLNVDSFSSIDKRLTDVQNQLTQLNSKIGSAAGQPAPQPAGPPAEDFNKVYTIDPGNSVILGNKNAPVTIVEFSDFQCPFCARFYSVVKDIMAAYPTQVRVIIKNFPLPFHPNARPAAKLAMAANEQGKFQPMMEMLLQNGGDVSDAKIKEYAQKIGLDYNKLMDDYKNKDAQWEKWLQADDQLVQSSDVRGTPSFFINGRKARGVDTSIFKAEIDRILAQKA